MTGIWFSMKDVVYLDQNRVESFFKWFKTVTSVLKGRRGARYINYGHTIGKSDLIWGVEKSVLEDLQRGRKKENILGKKNSLCELTEVKERWLTRENERNPLWLEPQMVRKYCCLGRGRILRKSVWVGPSTLKNKQRMIPAHGCWSPSSNQKKEDCLPRRL